MHVIMNINNIMADLERRHPGEKEYLQAVREVLISVEPVYNQHPVQSAPQAPVYPNANTKSSANPSPRGSSQSRNSSDSDDSFVDIISIFNNK